MWRASRVGKPWSRGACPSSVTEVISYLTRHPGKARLEALFLSSAGAENAMLSVRGEEVGRPGRAKGHASRMSEWALGNGCIHRGQECCGEEHGRSWHFCRRDPHPSPKVTAPDGSPTVAVMVPIRVQTDYVVGIEWERREQMDKYIFSDASFQPSRY
jgi:hypothetical protein